MKPVRLNHARMHGFSLVEVLIALVVLGVGLLGLARLQLGMLGSTAESVLQDTAVRLAEDKLESLRFELATGKVLQSGSDEAKAYDLTMQRIWTSAAKGNGQFDIMVTMQWREPRTGQENSLSIPAKLSASSLAAQGWLIQSGAPMHEPLP